MFKVFGVSDNEQKEPTEKMEIRPIHQGLEWEKIHIQTEESLDEDTEQADSEPIEDDSASGQIAVDILDMEDSIVIVAPIAGVDPNEIDISLSRNILTISWVRNESDHYSKTKKMLVEECFYGAFSRSVILPENLGFDKIYASMQKGVLIITLPKLTLESKSVKIHTD